MRKTAMRIFMVLGLWYAYACVIPNIKLAKVRFNVLDESEKPVKEASVQTVFKYGHLVKDAIIGHTDSNGYYSVCSRTPEGSIGISITKNNYYDTGLIHDFSKKKYGIWLPWNEQIKIVLRPVVNPVPMYARNLNWFEVPVIGKEIGYDLMVSDWVPPYGAGKVADFLIRTDKRFKNNNDYAGKLVMRFSNPNDGIQLIKEEKSHFKPSSSYRLPRTAPDNGYMPKLEKQRFRDSRGFHDDYAEESNYIFRVRSVTDKSGNLKQAMYGKIVGDIGFSPQDPKNSKIKIQYYLNPDFTRNLEFDPRRNLFTNLSEVEGVRLP